MKRSRSAHIFFLGLGLAACSEARDRGHSVPMEADGGSGAPDGSMEVDGGVIMPFVTLQDPATCGEAVMNRSYVGCDYWPTVVANAVSSIFDFAVVVANPGSNPADVTVTGPVDPETQVPTHFQGTVPPGRSQKIYLPWVKELKGSDSSNEALQNPFSSSVKKAGGAFHLVSSVPVLVYQFNALEYKAVGGKPGKDWSRCPVADGGCFSYSNDASLLLPSTAMTGNYRVMTQHGGAGAGYSGGVSGANPAGYIAITATKDDTHVKLRVSSTGRVVASDDGAVVAVAALGSDTYTLNAGDVIELSGGSEDQSDLSGSLIQADQPVQVIGGHPCFANPLNACDHLEESVLPMETLGKRYVVTRPTRPNGTPVGMTVRLVGNVDGTSLTYEPATDGAPAKLDAGQVVEYEAKFDFVVTGNHEFLVSVVQKSGSVVDPSHQGPSRGDPSLSSMVTVEQYRTKYVFLAPDDYDVNYADVVAPAGAVLTLDGGAVSVSPTVLGKTGFSVYRIPLPGGGDGGGTHTLESTLPCGLQVLGYGSYTSYQYPGGLNLLTIAPIL